MLVHGGATAGCRLTRVQRIGPSFPYIDRLVVRPGGPLNFTLGGGGAKPNGREK